MPKDRIVVAKFIENQVRIANQRIDNYINNLQKKAGKADDIYFLAESKITDEFLKEDKLLKENFSKVPKSELKGFIEDANDRIIELMQYQDYLNNSASATQTEKDNLTNLINQFERMRNLATQVAKERNISLNKPPIQVDSTNQIIPPGMAAAIEKSLDHVSKKNDIAYDHLDAMSKKVPISKINEELLNARQRLEEVKLFKQQVYGNPKKVKMADKAIHSIEKVYLAAYEKKLDRRTDAQMRDRMLDAADRGAKTDNLIEALKTNTKLLGMHERAKQRLEIRGISTDMIQKRIDKLKSNREKLIIRLEEQKLQPDENKNTGGRKFTVPIKDKITNALAAEEKNLKYEVEDSLRIRREVRSENKRMLEFIANALKDIDGIKFSILDGGESGRFKIFISNPNLKSIVADLLGIVEKPTNPTNNRSSHQIRRIIYCNNFQENVYRQNQSPEQQNDLRQKLVAACKAVPDSPTVKRPVLREDPIGNRTKSKRNNAPAVTATQQTIQNIAQSNVHIDDEEAHISPRKKG